MTALVEPAVFVPAGAQFTTVTGDVVAFDGAPDGVQECGTTGVTADNSANCLSSDRIDHQIFAIDEGQQVTLASNLTVDFGPRSSNWALGTPYSTEAQILGHSYSLLAGDTVASHLLHTDLPFSDAAATPSERTGTASFSAPIYGLIITDARLGATDGVLGAPGVTYPTVDTNRGFEFDCLPAAANSAFTGIPCSAAYNAFVDQFKVNTPSNLFVDESVTTGMDQTRVLTNVPDAPTITCPGPVAVNVGEVAHVSGGTFSDADSFPTVNLSASRGTVSQVGTGRSGTWSWDLDTSLSIASGPITVTATDDAGLTGSCSFNLTVNQVVTQLLLPGQTLNIGGKQATPTNPTIASITAPKNVKLAASPARFSALATTTGAAPVSLALIPKDLVNCDDGCSGALVGADPSKLVSSAKKPIKLAMRWDASVLRNGKASTLWVSKPIAGSFTPGPWRRVPPCQKSATGYLNLADIPCLKKGSFPGGDFKVTVLLLSADPRFRCR